MIVRIEHPARARPAAPAPAVTSSERATWARERERLLELLAQQQRIAQAGLVTAALAHDVNNQLTVMSITTAMSLRQDEQDEHVAALSLVQERCRVLSDTMRTFLSFVRRRDVAEGGTFTLTDMAAQTNTLAEPLAKSNGVTVKFEIVEDAEIQGELRVANQAILNLIANAVRACKDSRGNVVVTASCPSPGQARITVTDDGPGIADEVRRNLFRPFATANEESGGTGLGLFIVRLAIRRMNGTIRLLTSPQGSTFRIDLPTV
jgi:signal transduction histidine kinase